LHINENYVHRDARYRVQNFTRLFCIRKRTDYLCQPRCFNELDQVVPRRPLVFHYESSQSIVLVGVIGHIHDAAFAPNSRDAY
jgi:hypothetical protein